jgi:hypothetical protein
VTVTAAQRIAGKPRFGSDTDASSYQLAHQDGLKTSATATP